MNENDPPDGQPTKRADVGYKRPPAEHRFKKGQKPPPRKKKESEALSPRDLLWRILQEERRVIIDDKPQWMRVSEIVMKKAFHLAEKGSPTVSRLVTELLMSVGEKEERQEGHPRIIFDRDPEGRTRTETWRILPG